MVKILFKFQVILQNHEFELPHEGPSFHRWLPEGKKDAISLETRYPNTSLKIWFERRGYVKDEMIEYDTKRQEVDESIMEKQGVLVGGRLFCSLEVDDVSEEQHVTIKQDKVGEEPYQDLAKKFVKTIYEPISEFLSLIRIRFGQYWLRDFKKWDSTKESIGSYCRFFWIEWSDDNGNSWNKFTPDKESRSVVVVMSSVSGFRSFLGKEDWGNIPEILKNYHPSIAEITLARTHQYLDQNDLRHAIIEGATSVELATVEFVKSKLKEDSKLIKELAGFGNVSSSGQLVVLGAALGIPEKKIEDTIEVIDIRHKIVHEGLEPDQTIAPKIRSLLETISILLGEPKFRFPTSNPGNAIQSKERWEEE